MENVKRLSTEERWLQRAKYTAPGEQGCLGSGKDKCCYVTCNTGAELQRWYIRDKWMEKVASVNSLKLGHSYKENSDVFGHY